MEGPLHPQEEEFAVYRNGSWEVECCDQDGDLAYWSVSFNRDGYGAGVHVRDPGGAERR